MQRVYQFPLFVMLILFGFTASLSAKPLELCTHLGFEPYVITENNKIRGIDVDIVLKAMKNIKQKGNIRAYPWSRLIESLETGKCDIGFSLFDTEERRNFADFLFTIPLHYSTFSVFVTADKNMSFNRVKDFFGKTISHNKGFSLTVGLEQAVNDGHIKRIVFDDVKDAIRLLEKGRVDMIIDNEARMRYYLKKHNKQDKIKPLPVPFLPHQPAFMVISRNSNLKNISKIKVELENQLKELHLDGTIMNVTTQYLN